jgi:hypothetical protein
MNNTLNGAVDILMSKGYSCSEAVQEFKDTTNYFLRGTGRTVADIVYAEECALESIRES